MTESPVVVLAAEKLASEKLITEIQITEILTPETLTPETLSPKTDVPETLTTESLRQRLSCLIPEFLRCINYIKPPKVKRDALRQILLDRGWQVGLHVDPDDGSRMRFEAGLAVAAEMYPLHPFDIQVHIGLFTWLGFIIDDLNAELGPDLDAFQSRFFRGETQPHVVLEFFASVLRATPDYYDPVVANLIVLSALAFVNSNAIELRREYQSIVPTEDACNWPYYFRDKEGLPEVYTYFCFYKDLCPDISCFMPAAPEMGRFINLTNDILSFYKEEKAGEVRNYIHKQALSSGRSPMQVLEDTIAESALAYTRTLAILKDSSPYDELWHAYAMGYVAMHFNTRRYCLSEIAM
ncbi:hypothetical protein CSOJ01_12186 [Colletotrichum sojae]|uniref:Longiborneol synthase n=1 Tax=Colletotrichum sojae TaxID=2175907 RepID=A0A8H6MM43_9PEZI|nr:hypothetical protein CSOJ01_12186 [Colletotrichum sojae]